MSDEKRLRALAAYAEAFNKSETLRSFGVRIEFPEGKRAVAYIDNVTDSQRGGLGSKAVNGGVLAAMFDLILGVTSALVEPSRRVATVQLSVYFERPVTTDSFRLEGVVTNSGESLCFTRATLFDGNDRECANGQGVVAFGKGQWADGCSPAVN